VLRILLLIGCFFMMMTEASVFSNKFVISLYDLKLFLPYVVTVDQLPFYCFIFNYLSTPYVLCILCATFIISRAVKELIF